MPDMLYRRVKTVMARRGVTFRAMVIDALERSLEEKKPAFVLRDASAGYAAKAGNAVSANDINRVIDEVHEPRGHA